MNILLINHYAGGPNFGMEFRPHELSKRWQASGNNVEVIASRFSHLRKKQPTQYSQKIDTVNYKWLLGNSYSGNGIGRIFNIFLFVIQLIILAPYIALLKKPDVVISSSTYTFDIIPCWIIAKIARAKLVFEIHDLWPMSLNQVGGMSAYHPFHLAVSVCEYLSYKLSDKVVSILPNVYDHSKKFKLKKNNYIHLPNGYDFSTNKKSCSSKIKSVIQEHKKEGHFCIAYTGSIGEANNIDNFIEVAKKLSNEKIVFNVVGSGPKQKHLMQEIKKHSLNINYFGHINKSEINDFVSQNDMGMIYFKHLDLYKYGIGANKIFDYMHAKKPVILCCNTHNDPISNSKGGVVVDNKSPQTVANGIIKAAKMSSKKLKTMGDDGYKYLHKNHNYDKLAEQFIDFLND